MKFYQKRLRRNKIKEEKGKKNVEERDGQQGRKMFQLGFIC